MEKSLRSADYDQLRLLLRQLRDEAGLRQADVAERLGEPQSFVSKYEAGERRVDVIELGRIADALEVPRGALLRRLDPGWLETDPH